MSGYTWPGREFQAGRILCNQCGKQMAVKGIRMKSVEQGEWQMRYFVCPHCGAAYFCGATDEKQRELGAKREKLLKRLERGTKGIRPETAERYRRQAARLTRELQERREWVNEEGKRIFGEIVASGI